MRYSLIIILLILISKCQAQEITFLKTDQLSYNPYRLYVEKGSQIVNKNYLVAYDTYEGVGHHYIRFVQYDEYGNNIKEFSPKRDFGIAFTDDFIHFDNGELLLFGFDGDVSFNYYYDSSGNIKWRKADSFYYSYRMFEILNRSTALTELIKRVKNGTSFDYFSFLSKVNLETGNPIWTKPKSSLIPYTFNGPINSHSVQVVSGDSFYYVLVSSIINDSSLLVRTDTNGNIINYKILDEPNIYTFCYFNEYFVFVEDVGIYPRSTFKLHGFDKYMNKKWVIDTPKYNSVKRAEIHQTKTDKNGNLQLLIYRRDNNTDTTFNYYEVWTIDTFGEIVKYRRYYLPGEHLSFNSFDLCSDGSYFFVGSSTYNPDYTFILKTDKNGYIENPELFPLKIDSVQSNAIFDYHRNKSITIYPNPFKTNCTFQLPTQTSQKATLNLYSITGKLIKQEKFKGNSYEFFRSDLSGGLYLYQIILENKIFTGKLIVGDY
ncbi:MAG: T9SS type A sorting domain-containing protein [Bacteroidota bacterium]|nr:T9SS type A sorting domain-containing protein [Bacteroidota bacterium]